MTPDLGYRLRGFRRRKGKGSPGIHLSTGADVLLKTRRKFFHQYQCVIRQLSPRYAVRNFQSCLRMHGAIVAQNIVEHGNAFYPKRAFQL